MNRYRAVGFFAEIDSVQRPTAQKSYAEAGFKGVEAGIDLMQAWRVQSCVWDVVKCAGALQWREQRQAVVKCAGEYGDEE